ncbi:MAG: class I poly(R)-hydroxyalkanoic acid synthase [Micavibrio sp.]|nr:class I poly(R)-hydroxyalkanoic acid synthase [Micavibrio sp.]HCK32333.1 class I poly(R)-hydroxyalkanoic acid synthase [Rhodospirillaceae bacterium]
MPNNAKNTHKDTDKQGQKPDYPDFLETSQRIMDLWIRMGKMLGEQEAPLKRFESFAQTTDPFNLSEAVGAYWKRVMDDPEKFIQSGFDLWQQNTLIWQEIWRDYLKKGRQDFKDALSNPQESIKKVSDRRFKSDLWYANPYFHFLKEAYIFTAGWILKRVQNTDGMDKHTKEKLAFFTRQYIDALSPTNFPFSNPDVLQEIISTGGLNLIEGIENMLDDLESSEHSFFPRTTDKKAFSVGKNLAITDGAVVYQNDLMQLIQYTPSTDKAFKTPMLVVPPWINKYYILDMRPDNSYIKWMVDQGHSVFVISWVNPTEKHRDKSFEHYMEEGVLTAIDEIEKITNEAAVNAIGYCIGGTLLTVTLAYLASKGEQDKIKSATFLTTLVDFEEAGDLTIFIDDAQIKVIEEQMKEKGYLDATYLKSTFSLLRANDMIWSFVVNNYLLGKDPFPFDLLYWNDDAVNLPEAMHSYYLRNMYLENNLIKKNKLKIKDTPIDITKVKTPSYFLSTKEDHIAPWKATYQTTQYFSGHCTFTLAASGHIAGVVNPPKAKKYSHWRNDKTPADADEWFETATEHKGSWWSNWEKWVAKTSGNKVDARQIDKKRVIEKAPGSYVK